MELIFASNNLHKVREIKSILGNSFTLLSLKDINILEDIPENEPLIEGNALAKARYVFNATGLNTFADDTGLEIDALGGEPGVFSARYAGKNCRYEDNIRKVLSAMKDKKNRSARFRTVIALVINGEIKTFEGIVEGTIRTKKRGRNGFGYDPIFQPAGLLKTFAEISLEEKNRISHRAIALQKLVDYLKTIV